MKHIKRMNHFPRTKKIMIKSSIEGNQRREYNSFDGEAPSEIYLKSVKSVVSQIAVDTVFSHRNEPKVSKPSVWVRMPNTSLSISMGLAGQASMWKAASQADFVNRWVNASSLHIGFWMSSLVVGVVLSTALMLKGFLFFPLVEDEYKDSSRIHFFNMPHLMMILLVVAAPDEIIKSVTSLHILWSIGFLIQTWFTQKVYEMWLYSDIHTIHRAKPPFLLSTVGWFFLASLGAQTEIEEAWGIALPTFCFAFGIVLYFMVVTSIFNNIHLNPQTKGSPALFLIIAPPSVGVIAWDSIDKSDGFSDISLLLLGWCLCVFMLLAGIGPEIIKPPAVFGIYWAYVFPMSALASALIRYALTTRTLATELMAIAFLALASFAVLLVFTRMSIHSYKVIRGRAEWNDPLLSQERLNSIQPISYSQHPV